MISTKLRIGKNFKSIVVISRRMEVQDLAQQIGNNVFAADDVSEGLDAVKRNDPELILFDYRCSPCDIDNFFNAILNISQANTVVIGGEDNETQIAASFVEKRTFHYVDGIKVHSLNIIFDKILKMLHRPAVDEGRDAFFSGNLSELVGIVGKSTSIVHTLRMIELVASSQCNPVLIVGEMGTGKELAARAIHAHRCPDKEFVAVNCASLSANLLESELFGHEKGAFTSADHEKTGLLELAGEGSIFLDEISEMPMELQAKILRVIQEKTFRKVGGTKEIICKATIIASSNRELKKEVQSNRFRGDLYHRLSIFPIILSPLRFAGRRGDIRLLAEYFLRVSTICPEKSGQIKSITKLALDALEGYDWPGNVRELRNVMERAILLESTNKIRLNSIIIHPEDPEEFFNNDSEEKIKDFSLAKAEQELIARVLRETNWQKTKAAELLGISRATLYAKVKQHNIESDCEQKAEDSIIRKEVSSPMAVA